MFEDNPRGAQAVQISSSFLGLASAVFALRLYTRLFLVRCPGAEDYFVAFAWACSIGLTITIGLQAANGMGQHLNTIKPDESVRSLKAFYASLIVYNLSLGLVKTSILLQYRRVFTTKRFKLLCLIVLVIVALHTTWSVLGSVFACVPIHAFWFRNIPSKCIDQYAMWFTNASFSIVTDFLLICLPMPVVKRLNLARRQKQALIGIFAVGGLVCIVSILRLHSLVAISNSKDPTYDNPPAATWSSVETNIGIICSSLPCLRPLMAKYIPSMIGTNSPRTDPVSSAASFFSRSIVLEQRKKSTPEDDEIPINEGNGSMSATTCGACAEEGSYRVVENEGNIVVTTEVRVRVDGKDKSTERTDELMEKEHEWDMKIKRVNSADSGPNSSERARS